MYKKFGQAEALIFMGFFLISIFLPNGAGYSKLGPAELPAFSLVLFAKKVNFLFF